MAAPHQCQCAYSYELVNETVAGNERAIIQSYLAAKQRPVRDNYMVANPAVMPDVTVGHQEIV